MKKIISSNLPYTYEVVHTMVRKILLKYLQVRLNIFSGRNNQLFKFGNTKELEIITI